MLKQWLKPHTVPPSTFEPTGRTWQDRKKSFEKWGAIWPQFVSPSGGPRPLPHGTSQCGGALCRASAASPKQRSSEDSHGRGKQCVIRKRGALCGHGGLCGIYILARWFQKFQAQTKKFEALVFLPTASSYLFDASRTKDSLGSCGACLTSERCGNKLPIPNKTEGISRSMN